MGQRLVIELIDEEQNTIGVVYYHWLAYFGTTIQELAILCRVIKKAKENNKDVLEAVLDDLERVGGGIGRNDANLAEASKRFPGRTFKEDISRNNGLLYLGEDEIKSTMDIAEGTAAIFISSEEVRDDVFHTEFLDIDFEDSKCIIDGREIDIDPTFMSFDECIRLSEFIDKLYDDMRKGDRENG